MVVIIAGHDSGDHLVQAPERNTGCDRGVECARFIGENIGVMAYIFIQISRASVLDCDGTFCDFNDQATA